MKKIYPLLICLLSFVAAKAQSGNVGINTPTPNATLDVQATSDNTTDNLEGILIPRVSKAKAFNMANGTNTLDESTMIYVNDTISTAFASGMAAEIAKVEAINENGFYFWNGDKWVKSAGSEGTPWLKDEDGNIVLNNPDSRDSVSYSREGMSAFVSKKSFEYSDSVFFKPSTGLYQPGGSVPTNYYHTLFQGSQNLFPSDTISALKQLSITGLSISQGDNNDDKSFYTDVSDMRTTPSNSKNYSTLVTKRNILSHTGTGSSNYLRTLYNSAVISPNSTAAYAEVSYDILENFSDSASTNNIVHVNRYNTRGTGDINWVTLNRNFADLKRTSSSDINVFKMAEDRIEVDDDYTGTIDRLWGNHIIFKNTGSTTPTVNKVYGLNISNVNWGAEENYAIFTSLGKVSFGDSLQLRNVNATESTSTADKIIVADTDGVLKTTSQSIAALGSKWSNIAADGATPLTNFADGTTARPNRKSVTFFDSGSLRLGFDDSFANVDVEGNPVDPINSDSEADKGITVNLYDGSGVISIDGKNYVNQDSTSFAMIQATDNRAAILSVANTTSQQQWNISATSGNNGLAIQETTNGTTAMFMDDSGNVGINNFDPQQKLDVSGNIRVRTLPVTDGLITERLLVTSDIGTVKSLPQEDARAILSKWSNDDTNEYINLSKLSDGTTDRPESDNLFILDNGKVGLGTTEPRADFDVAKWSMRQGEQGRQTTIAVSGGTAPFGMYIGHNVDRDETTEGQFKSVATPQASGKGSSVVVTNFLTGAVNFANFVKADGTMDQNFNLYNESYLSVTPDKEIGIGTNSPDERLHVNGNVKANTFIAASGATFPDYVFEKYYQGESELKSDYQFKSLSEIEDFAKQNGHLPGYKSAKEIATEGQIDITETQLTNVEKIEELYLHTIDQEKKIKEKDAQIEDLESRIARLEKLLLNKD